GLCDDRLLRHARLRRRHCAGPQGVARGRGRWHRLGCGRFLRRAAARKRRGVVVGAVPDRVARPRDLRLVGGAPGGASARPSRLGRPVAPPAMRLPHAPSRGQGGGALHATGMAGWLWRGLRIPACSVGGSLVTSVERLAPTAMPFTTAGRLAIASAQRLTYVNSSMSWPCPLWLTVHG